MKFINLIKKIEQIIDDPTSGLPEELFEFISRITPIVNVDLLIKNEKNQTLLSWRDDLIHGKGWHIPGGIVRFKETLKSRVKKVALLEIGTIVECDPDPIAINEIISEKRDIRGHFISFLYKCFLKSSVKLTKNLNKQPQSPGFLKWHSHCPKNLISSHKIYRKFIEGE